MTHVRRASLIVAMLLLGASAAHAGPLYVLSGAHNGYEGAVSFGSIDVATGAYTEITAALDGGSVKNLAWNPALNAFYVIQGNEPAVLRTLATNGTLYMAENLGQGVDPSVGRFGSIGFESTSEFQQIGSLDPVFQQMVLA